MNTVTMLGNYIYSLSSHDKKGKVSVIRPDEQKYLFYINDNVDTLCNQLYRLLKCRSAHQFSTVMTKTNGVFTLAVSGTGTGAGIGTYIVQKLFTLAVSGARTGPLKAIEKSLKHTTQDSFRT